MSVFIRTTSNLAAQQYKFPSTKSSSNKLIILIKLYSITKAVEYIMYLLQQNSLTDKLFIKRIHNLHVFPTSLICR